MRVLVVFGTRPEAIKCIPVIQRLYETDGMNPIVCVTGQHRDMLDQMLKLADIQPDYDLDIMRPGQSLQDITMMTLERIQPVIKDAAPDLVLVQGDTSTAFIAALAAFYEKVPVGHIEAGLRSHNVMEPWPEEANRKLISVVTKFHFAPTEVAANHLRAENIPESQIYITGNTVIDALFFYRDHTHEDPESCAAFKALKQRLDPDKRRILVTAHRRENQTGERIQSICLAIKQLVKRGDVEVIFPVHMNPNVRLPIKEWLSPYKEVHLLRPLDYLPFIEVMQMSDLILSDSGGIQEEAPALGKPVLVLREVTERQEAVEAGTAKLVGTDTDRIVSEASRLLDDDAAYAQMSQAKNPFGDGTAAQQIVGIIQRWGAGEEVRKVA